MTERPLSPHLLRRRELRRRKRQELTVQTWRVSIYFLLASSFGWLLLRYGWTVEDVNKIFISGNSGLSAEQVAKSGGLSFPQPLFQITPRELEKKLVFDFPVQSASVERRLLPARLEVHLLRQTPIARAVRQQAGMAERGMIDADGHWIPLSMLSKMPAPLSSITVNGWNFSQRCSIAQLLQQRYQLKGILKTINIDPSGRITLITSRLGEIDLGRDQSQLDKQIRAIARLSTTLPAHLINDDRITLDLTNPDRPELQLPTKPFPSEMAPTS
ncbi:FtsQ-type POTRA domain-containing protein [Synechococcus sp. M16CYN]|uniref:cell division protein FtsQ/DivIB n=1 Tax=Synechococcus sp. M16CYN TaxID=3103139 RepID=UPI00324FDFF8